MIHIPFDNQYLSLGDGFYVKNSPSAVARPVLIKFNEALANTLGISLAGIGETEIAALFSGNTIAAGAEPIAMAYAGHQFGQFVPQLGDGRAILLGELTANDGVRYGIQLKGSGRTYFSRGGDGRATLGPVLREYLLSEAMAKLNVPTTRALAAVTTGEDVARERLLPGGIITRVAASFVRVGTFEYFRARGNVAAIQKLADHVIKINYPALAVVHNPYIALLQAVADRQAFLIAQWMCLGFIHGVMNTDNMSIAGETIDYGPCAFIDAYHHNKVFSSIDQGGRYAYRKQPAIGLWNLSRLAECLLPLFPENTDAAIETAQTVLKTYIATYEKHWLAGMRAKCGLTALDNTDQEDKSLIDSLLDRMAANAADFSLTFFYLSGLHAQPSAADRDCCDLFDNPTAMDSWLLRWRERLSKETRSDGARQADMRAVNPVYIPRNHQIEAAIRAAEDRGDFSVFHALHEVLQDPYSQQVGKDNYQQPPAADEIVTQTFCGT